MISDKFIKVRDWVRVGKQIEAWSRGTITAPGTIAELKDQLPGSVLEIGPGYADNDAIHYSRPPATSQQVSFIIPHKDDIDDPIPPGSYPLPMFYSAMAFGEVDPVIAHGEEFRSCRIADYSASKCM
ncbi:MAG: hypothetical protein IAE87_07775 [Rhodobacteraceae bacterium]|jgi:hypothetical protein|nr:hypothetical protein [Paracoccaceae bacterium]